MTPAQRAASNAKDQRALAWYQSHRLQFLSCPSFQQGLTISPLYTCPGSSANLGGQYISEPGPTTIQSPPITNPNGYEGNWCGPGAATAAYLHWNPSAVYNFGSITVPTQNGSTWTYSHGQGWMAWFASVMPVDGQNGVMLRPYAYGTTAGTLRDGLNEVVNSAVGYQLNYYITHASYNETDMLANIEYDLSNDGHPVIYNANTNHLFGWNPGTNIAHWIQGYGFNTTQVLYSDSMWQSLQGNPEGDHAIPKSQMWTAIDYLYDSAHVSYGYIIV